jgi:Kef-type K+ transport system membrane component KefB
MREVEMKFDLFLLQLALILAAANLVGGTVRRFGQPRVVGQIMAGILLGPSFFGWLAPSLYARLFAVKSLEFLNVTSQLGLILFMFLVGLRLDLKHLRRERGVVLLAATSSIIAPFTASVPLALYLRPRFPATSERTLPFVLFMGVAISITAFPVLASILKEHGLFGTRLGTIALSCAAVDDVSAWLVLAAITALVQHEGSILNKMSSFGAYLLLMITVVRPIVRALRNSDGFMHTVAPLLMLASACATQWIGVHALFGAFFAGAVFPKPNSQIELFAESAEPLVAALLLPVFFAFTGLRASLALISGTSLWLWSGLIFGVAVAAKAGGAFMGAKLMGLPDQEAVALGILLNTRGLVELVVLNVGFELGILSHTLFTMMILVAVATTVMTSPLLRLLLRPRSTEAQRVVKHAPAPHPSSSR